jgi:glutaminyl-tRNA synthetase
MNETPPPAATDFIRDMVRADIASGKYGGRVATRFPPEPNGYLHIGHAKAICLDFGIAEEFGGECHLRFDDTNPETETVEYAENIIRDVKWLGFDWGPHLYYACDYFERMHDAAVELIRRGKAYVCELSPEAFKPYRGVPTRPGKPSPFRDRPVDDNLDLFARMRAGEFEDGRYVLRAKIDMSSPNLHMRDPALYRIKRSHHYRTGDAWCLYPTYDFAHCLEDSFERITHSLCTLEFEVHRPLYDWILEALDLYRPQQTEFARLNLSYTIMSKRKLLQLVQEGHVQGWDDPRMPTLCGLRRRGYTPRAIRAFCERIGITKFNSLTDVALLEHCVRDDLNRTSPRAMAVLRPLKLIIDNYPEGAGETFEAVNNPEDPSAGTRQVPFSRELYIERDDFAEDPPKKFYRLGPGREVRLRYACYVTCTGVDRDPVSGDITAVHGTYDPASRGGSTPDNRKVRGTIHWVSAAHAVQAETRLYDRLFNVENPADDKSGKPLSAHLNPRSLESVRAWVEPSLADAQPGARFQFERLGYFCADTQDSRPGAPVFNRTVTLRDSWAKRQQQATRGS